MQKTNAARTHLQVLYTRDPPILSNLKPLVRSCNCSIRTKNIGDIESYKEEKRKRMQAKSQRGTE